MYLEISLFVLSVVFLLMVALTIPFLIQIGRTARSITTTLDMLNQNLPDILKNLEEITNNVNNISHTVNNQIESLSHAVRRVQGAVEIFLDLGYALRSSVKIPFFKTMSTAMAVLKGGRVFLDVYRSSR